MPGGPAVEGEWQHLLVRRSGTDVTLWVDGTQIPGSLTVNEAIQTSGTPRLGVRGDEYDEWFDGAIAQVARWSTALTSAQIGDLAGGDHSLDFAAGALDWFLPLGRDDEDSVGGTFTATPMGTTVGGAPPVAPPTIP